MELETLKDLFVDQLKDLYSAETQIIAALPKMADATTDSKLKKAFLTHLEQTREQKTRLEKIAESYGISPGGKKCKGAEGLIKEGSEMIQEDADPAVRDAGLIAAAQRVEHYEIAGYGCARTYAKLLGEKDAVKLLQQTLDEEGDTDKLLTEIAENVVNPEAKEAVAA
jgi:ferritin-like metal-binding protein YciE